MNTGKPTKLWEYTGQQRPRFAIAPLGGQESVWDYPRPPAFKPDAREIVVRYGEFELTRTTSAIRILETASPPTVYIPRTDICVDVMTRTSNSSICEWKGAATYWTIEIDGLRVENAGWSYENPSNQFKMLRGHLSFYPSKVDCFVDGQPVRAQPGGFYGGWVTDEIVGPYKGESGTEAW